MNRELKLLVIEDDEDDLFLFKSFLSESNWNINIDWAENYERGMEKYLKNDYNICFVDHFLGSRTGIEFIQEAKTTNCTIPLVLLTGLDNKSIDIEAIDNGAADYIPKTEMSMSMLERTIRHALLRHEQNIRLRQAQLRLLETEKFNLTGRMAGIIGHEVRNPLTNILLANEQLKENLTQDQEEELELSEMVKRNAHRISKLIDDLLNSTKMLSINKSEIGIEEVIKKAITACIDRIQLKKIQLETIGLETNTITEIDTDKIHIALVNIIINAIEALVSVENPKLTIRSKVVDEGHCIEIQDNGCGMSKETKSKIFDPFFTGRSGGLGLGMTNVKNILLQHNAQLNVESEEGKGTTFIIDLPSQ